MRKIIGVVGIFVAVGLTSAQPPRGSAADEKAIRKAAEGYATAFNKGDIDGVMAQWAADADYVDESGKSYKGRAAIAALFKQQHGNLKGHKLKIQVKTLRFVSPEVAIQDGVVEMTSPVGAVDSSRYTAVLVKSSGNWLLSSVRDFPNESETTSPAAQLKQLEWLVGDWGHEDKSVQVRVSCRWIMNKNFLHLEYEVKPKDGEETTVSQWVGWDPLNGRIKSWFIDSHGGHGEGAWSRKGNTWTIAATGVLADGRQASATNAWKMIDDKTCLWQSLDRQVDGQPLPDVEVKFVRK